MRHHSLHFAIILPSHIAINCALQGILQHIRSTKPPYFLSLSLFRLHRHLTYIIQGTRVRIKDFYDFFEKKLVEMFGVLIFLLYLQ